MIDEISAPVSHGYYGVVNGLSANALYNKYLAWFKEKYKDSDKPLTFKEWLLWAKNKGMIKTYQSDGEQSEQKESIEGFKNTGLKVIIVGVIIMLLYLQSKK